MKKILTTITVLTGFIALLSPTAFAQSEEELREEDSPAVIEDVEGLRADFVQKTQNPNSKEVEFVIILNSQIDSDRVKITWELDGRSNFVTPSESIRYSFIEAGQSYQVPIKIKPVGQGVTEIRAKVEAFKADTTYIVTVRKNFATNTDGEILPISDDYQNAKTTAQIINAIKWILLTCIIVVLLAISLKLFIKYLNRDDVKAYDNRSKGKPKEKSVD